MKRVLAIVTVVALALVLLLLVWYGVSVFLLVFASILLAIFYLDSYRNRLEKERVQKVASEATMAAIALQAVRPAAREELLADLSKQNRSRIRLYAADGHLELDSWRRTGPTSR